MTRIIKTVLAALYALWSALEVLWMKTRTMMYLASAPVWFSFFEMFDQQKTGSWLQWLWLAIGVVQVLALVAAPILAAFRRYRPFLVLLGGQLVIRLIWLCRSAAEFRADFIWALALHAAIFAAAIWIFRKQDMDAA